MNIHIDTRAQWNIQNVIALNEISYNIEYNFTGIGFQWRENYINSIFRMADVRQHSTYAETMQCTNCTTNWSFHALRRRKSILINSSKWSRSSSSGRNCSKLHAWWWPNLGVFVCLQLSWRTCLRIPLDSNRHDGKYRDVCNGAI